MKLFSILLFFLTLSGWALAQAPTAQIALDVNQSAKGCAPWTVKFKTAQVTGTISTYSWTTSDGQSSSNSNPTFGWVNPGTYTVNLKVSNNSGSNNATPFKVTVWKNPTASFTASDTTICTGTSVTFTNSTVVGDTAINNWLWDFGNLSSSTSISPTGTYNNAGNFTVTLTATDLHGCIGKKTKSAYIKVTAPPSVTITSTPASLVSCTSPFSVDFNSTIAGGTTPLTYTWNFGNGQNSSLSNPPAVNFVTLQTYPVTLEVNDGSGCKVTSTKNVTLSNYTAKAYIVGNDTICKGSPVSFRDSSAGHTTSAWVFGNGATSSAANPPAQSFSTAGVYYIKLTSGNGTCNDLDSVKLVVLDDPGFDFVANTTNSCETPFPVNFTIQPAQTNSTYAWTFGPTGASSTQASPTYSYLTEGNFTVSCTVTNFYGCKKTITKNNYISISKPDANFIGDTLFGCVPFTTDFTNQSTVGYNGTNGNSATYQWTFENVAPGTTTSNSANPVNVLYPDSGNYDVKLVITNALGCKDSITKPAYIKPGIPPVPKFSISDTIGCHPFTIKMTDSSSTYSDEWQWDFGVGNSTQQNPTFIYDTYFPGGTIDTGFFDIQLIVGYHKCYDTLKVDSMVYVKEPSPFFHVYENGQRNENVICNYDSHWVTFKDSSLTNKSTSTYTWDFGDPASGALNSSNNKDTVSHFYANPGSYKVQLIINSSLTQCGDTVDRTIVVSDFSTDITSDLKACILTDTVDFTGTQIELANLSGTNPATIPLSSTVYSWDFGDGTPTIDSVQITSISNVNNVYSNPNDSLVVTLYAINAVGCRDTVTETIKVKNLPTANFTTSPQQGCAPLSVNFDGTGSTTTNTTATITNYNWTFSGGSTATSTLNTPTNIVFQSGTHQVSLIVKDSEGCISPVKTATVSVNDPTAVANVVDNWAPTTDSLICSGSAFSFNANGSLPATGLEYSWTFGDGANNGGYSSSGNLVTHTYQVNLTDTFTVKLFIKDILGCLDSTSKTVIVSKPIADFSILNPIADCAPITFHLNNTGCTNDVTNVNYNFGDGSSFNQAYADSLTHTWQAPGVYDVTLIATNVKGCQDTITKNDYVSVGGPVASFDYSPKSGCPPLTVTFTTTGVNNVSSYQFVFTDGGDTTIKVLNSDSITFTYTFTNSGSFSPIMIIKDVLDSSSGDTTYCVRSLQNGSPIFLAGPQVDFTADTTDLCKPGPVVFTNLTNNNGTTPTGFKWEFGDGSNNTTTSNPTHLYSTLGYYDVTLTYYSAPNCTSKVTKPNFISVFQGPNINLDITGAGCPPYGKQFEADTAAASAAGIFATSILWNFGDGDTSTFEDPYHTYTTSGNYNPTLTVSFSNGCDYTYSNSGALTVHQLPEASFSSTPIFNEIEMVGLDFNNTSKDDTTYLWNFGDGTSSNLQHPSHNYTNEGEYDVILTVTNQYGCIDTAMSRVKFEFNVYIPNIFTPDEDGVNDYFAVKIPGYDECAKLQVFDRWGIKRYQNDNYKNDWNGLDSNGKKLPEDTYYYILNYCDKVVWNGWVFISYPE